MTSPSSMTNHARNTLACLMGKSLMLTSDWSRAEIDALLAVASRFEAADRAGKSTAFLPDQLAYALFFDNSTRTKSAWAGASSRLGMRPVIVDGSSTQVEHGETAEETGAMLGMNSHAMGIRHDLILGAGNTFMRSVKAGIDDYLKATNDARKVPVAMSWAYSPSYAKPLSVPQGIAMLMAREGAQVTLAHPEGYRLMDSTLETARKHAAESGGKFEVVHDMDAAFKDADVVYPKSWGPYDLMLERVDANSKRDKAAMGEIERRALDRNASHKDWICDERRMALTTGGDALYMHCLPADIGDEVTPGVMAKHKINVAREANKKMYVVMALLAVAKVENLGAKFDEVLR